MNTALHKLLETFRQRAQTEREKGNYFEKLVKAYLLEEPKYKDLFNGQVYLWEEWRVHQMKKGISDPGVDAGIDLVAVENVAENPRIFAIQAKFYDSLAPWVKNPTLMECSFSPLIAPHSMLSTWCKLETSR